MQVVNQPLFVGEKDYMGLAEILSPVVFGWNKKKMAGSHTRAQGNPSGTAFPEGLGCSECIQGGPLPHLEETRDSLFKSVTSQRGSHGLRFMSLFPTLVIRAQGL